MYRFKIFDDVLCTNVINLILFDLYGVRRHETASREWPARLQVKGANVEFTKCYLTGVELAACRECARHIACEGRRSSET